MIRDTGLAPHGLVLEITESVLMENAVSAVEKLRALKGLGLWVAIDDFGMGYSSLSSIKRFPVDMLKVHKSFIDELGNSDENTAIVHAMIALGHTLGLTVVAEGVETAAPATQLGALDCNWAQAYTSSHHYHTTIQRY